MPVAPVSVMPVSVKPVPVVPVPVVLVGFTKILTDCSACLRLTERRGRKLVGGDVPLPWHDLGGVVFADFRHMSAVLRGRVRACEVNL